MSEEKEKLCIIKGECFCFTLIVDEQEISFQGRWNVDYFKRHYEELGYTVKLEGF
jgi:hypothetical protein